MRHDRLGDADCGPFNPVLADPGGNHRATDTLDSVNSLFYLENFSIHIDAKDSYNDNHN